MAIASLVLGIVSIILGFVPFCGTIAIVPAIVGAILGIVVIAKKQPEVKEGEESPKSQKGLAIAGLVMCIIAILVISYYLLVISAGVAMFGSELENAARQLNNIDFNELNTMV